MERRPQAHDPAADDKQVHARLTGGLPAIIGMRHG
jgi:hypothetical protein